MKYTIPYEDKISLPHIKKLNEINIKTGEIYQEDNDLVGKVIVYGEYSLDNSEDIIEFTHEIPISLLVDDEEIDPKISFSNLEYEVVKGRGIELMFDLDVTLDERDDEEEEQEDVDSKQFQDQVDQKLNAVLDKRDDLTFKEVNDEINVFDLDKEKASDEDEQLQKLDSLNKSLDDLEKRLTDCDDTITEQEEQVEEARDEVDVTCEEQMDDSVEQDEERKDIEEELAEEMEEQMDDTADEIEVEIETEGEEVEVEIEEDEVEVEEETDVDALIEEETGSITVSPGIDTEDFDIGFVSNVNDKYTTYKVLILEDGEIIDEVLEEKELSREQLCEEYEYDGRKYVLKIKDE